MHHAGALPQLLAAGKAAGITFVSVDAFVQERYGMSPTDVVNRVNTVCPNSGWAVSAGGASSSGGSSGATSGNAANSNAAGRRAGPGYPSNPGNYPFPPDLAPLPACISPLAGVPATTHAACTEGVVIVSYLMLASDRSCGLLDTIARGQARGSMDLQESVCRGPRTGGPRGSGRWPWTGGPGAARAHRPRAALLLMGSRGAGHAYKAGPTMVDKLYTAKSLAR